MFPPEPYAKEGYLLDDLITNEIGYRHNFKLDSPWKPQSNSIDRLAIREELGLWIGRSQYSSLRARFYSTSILEWSEDGRYPIQGHGRWPHFILTCSYAVGAGYSGGAMQDHVRQAAWRVTLSERIF